MKNLLILFFTFYAFTAFSQINLQVDKVTEVDYKYRLSVPMITVPQLFTKSWDDRKHTQHIELHIKRNLDDKNIIGLKLATWRLFQPMGINWWDGLKEKLDAESEFYSGHVRASGIGVSYQRMLWKGLFASVEVLPQFQTYLDEQDKKIGDGFQLYNSYHLGYHITFGKQKRFFVEPQVHSQHWMLRKDGPDDFRALDDKWQSYFLFEPNLYFGIKF